MKNVFLFSVKNEMEKMDDFDLHISTSRAAEFGNDFIKTDAGALTAEQHALDTIANEQRNALNSAGNTHIEVHVTDAGPLTAEQDALDKIENAKTRNTQTGNSSEGEKRVGGVRLIELPRYIALPFTTSPYSIVTFRENIVPGIFFTGGGPSILIPHPQSDVTGDGRSDVVFVNDNHETWLWSNGESYNAKYLGNAGDYTFLGVGDFAGDGMSDIMWQSNQTGEVGIWQDGKITSWKVLGFTSTTDTKVVGIGDFNNDSKDDALWRCADGTIGYWSGNSSEWHVFGTNVSNDWIIKGVGDFNGNGKDDILWSKADGSTIGLWLDGTDTWQQITDKNNSGTEVIGIGKIFSFATKDNCIFGDSIVMRGANGDIMLYNVNDKGIDNWTILGNVPNGMRFIGVSDGQMASNGDLLFYNDTTGELGCMVDAKNWKSLGYADPSFKPSISIA